MLANYTLSFTIIAKDATLVILELHYNELTLWNLRQTAEVYKWINGFYPIYLLRMLDIAHNQNILAAKLAPLAL